MASFAIEKDANAVLDYKFDWAPNTNGVDGAGSDWLDTANSETISTKTVTAATGITIDSSSITDTNTSVTVWLSGGTAGTSYDILCHIVTSAGREDDRTLTVYVVSK